MKKETQRITLDDLAGIVQRDFATKKELDAQTERTLDFIREQNADLLADIRNDLAKLPTRDELAQLLALHARVTTIEHHLGIPPVEQR